MLSPGTTSLGIINVGRGRFPTHGPSLLPEMISARKRRWKLLSISYFMELNKGGLELKRSCGKILL
jgi:hypothetical protein